MNGWFWADGHLGWPLFLALVYSGGLVLGLDYVWRIVRCKTRVLLVVAAIAWLAGLTVITFVFG